MSDIFFYMYYNVHVLRTCVLVVSPLYYMCMSILCMHNRDMGREKVAGEEQRK